jgi:hypothetical protein
VLRQVWRVYVPTDVHQTDFIHHDTGANGVGAIHDKFCNSFNITLPAVAKRILDFDGNWLYVGGAGAGGGGGSLINVAQIRLWLTLSSVDCMRHEQNEDMGRFYVEYGL